MDGLVSNFALIMGVVGGSGDDTKPVVLAGLAGLAARFRRRGRDPGGRATSRSSAATSESTTSVPSDPPAQGSTS